MTAAFVPVDIAADSETRIEILGDGGTGLNSRTLTEPGMGWRVVGFTEVLVDERVQVQSPDSYGSMRYETKTERVTRKAVLLTRPFTAVEADERRRVEIREQVVNELTNTFDNEVYKLQRERDDAAKLVEDRDKIITSLRGDVSVIQSERSTLRLRCQKMEADLAKARDAVGALKWKEIMKGEEDDDGA